MALNSPGPKHDYNHQPRGKRQCPRLAVSYYEALNRRDFDAYNVLFADDVTFEAAGGGVGGLETVKFFDSIWPAAFSDFTIESIYHLGDGNRVVCYNRATGTRDGALLMADGSEVPATGHKVNAPYFASFEVRDGKIVSAYIYFDRMLLAEQLGLIPAVNA
jgi:ketosteroid isomerase-like protein